MARHGNRQDFVQPDWHLVSARPHDPGLSRDGLGQAKALAKRLASLPIHHLVSSPCLRAVQTAAEAASLLHLPIRIEFGFCEFLCADWFPRPPEWLSPHALRKQFPAVMTDSPSCVQPVFPETPAELLARVRRAISGILNQLEGNLLVVGHGATLMGIQQALVPGARDHEHGFCCLAQLVQDGEWRVGHPPDTTHLETEPGTADSD